MERDMATAMNRRAPMRVVVADSPSAVRIALRAALEAIEGVAVVGEASTSSELVRQTLRLAPDVVLINPRLPGDDAVDACRTLRAMDRPPTVVAFVTYFSGDEARRLRSAGAEHYVVKEVSGQSLAAVLRALAPREAATDAGQRLEEGGLVVP